MAAKLRSGVAAYAMLAGLLLGVTLATRWIQESGGSSSVTLARDATRPEPDTLEVLSAETLRKRVIEIFPVGYLTLMAIIQGAAFGVLFIAFQQYASSHALLDRGLSFQSGTVLIEALATGLAIVIITHLCLLLTVIERWAATVLDTLIPYLLGFAEIWMALATGHKTSWWLALAITSAVAVLAFWHTRAMTVRSSFGTAQKLYEKNRRSVTRQMGVCGVMCAISVFVAVQNLRDACGPLLNIALNGVVILMGIVLLLMGISIQNSLYKHFGIPKKHFRSGSR